jgi:hypothetical protein
MEDFPKQSRVDTDGDPRFVLLFRNEALDSKGATATASSQQPTGSLVPANALSDSLDTATKSGPIADEPGGIYYCDVAFNRTVAVDTALVAKHNIRRPLSWKFYTGSPQTNAPIWDSGWISPIVRAELTEFTFPEWDFIGGPPERVIADQAARVALYTPVYADQVYYGVTHARLSIDGRAGNNLPLQWGDPSESSDAFLFSYVMVTRRFRPRVNLQNGWTLGYEYRDTTTRVESGGLLGRSRPPLRTFQFNAGFLSPSEGFGDIYTDLIQGEASLGRVFVVPQPQKPSLFHEQAFIGTITSQGGVSEFALDLDSATLTLTETE